MTSSSVPHTLLWPVLLLAGALKSAAEAPQQKSFYHANAASENAIGYTQAVRVGDTLHGSGSVGAGDMAAAMRQAYGEVRTTLAAHGLGFRNGVRENVYAVNLDDFIRNKDVRKAFYGSEYPAATRVQVRRLFSSSLVVEVDVTAVFAKQ